MMSALEGGGRSWKSGTSKGGSGNYKSDPNAGNGRRGSKIPKNLRTSYLEAP